MGENFVGPAGKLLDEILDNTSWREGRVAFLNAVQCFPGLTANGEINKPTMEQVRCCRPLLLKNLRDLGAPVSVGSGQWGIRALTDNGTATVGGKHPSRLRALTIPGLDHQCAVTTGTYHPAWVLRGNPQGREILREDLEQVYSQRERATWERDPVEIPPIVRMGPDTLFCYDGKTVALDTEFGPNGDVYCVSLYDGETLFAAPIDRPEADWDRGSWIQAFEHLLQHATILGHQARADVLALARMGVRLPEWARVECSLAASRMTFETDPDRSLETLAAVKLGFPDYAAEIGPWKRKHPTDFGAHAPLDVLLRYCAGDTYASWVLMESLRPGLPGPLWALLMEGEWSLILATFDGQHVDASRLTTKIRSYKAKVASRLSALRRLVGIKDFNPREDAGLDYFWKTLKWPQTRMGKAKPSLDEESLKKIIELRPGKDAQIARALLDLRAAETAYNRLSKDIFLRRDDAGCTHAEFSTCGTRTLRDSSRRPNHQNVSLDLRGVFTSRWGTS